MHVLLVQLQRTYLRSTQLGHNLDFHQHDCYGQILGLLDDGRANSTVESR